MKEKRLEPNHTYVGQGDATTQSGAPPEPAGSAHEVGGWMLEVLPGLEFTFVVHADGRCEVLDHEHWEWWLGVYGHDTPELRLLGHLFCEEPPYREAYRQCLQPCQVPAWVVADVARAAVILTASPAARLPEAMAQGIEQALKVVFWEQVNLHLDPPLERA